MTPGADLGRTLLLMVAIVGVTVVVVVLGVR